MRDGLAARQLAQQTAHDFAAARFRQVVAKTDVFGFGDRANFFCDPLPQSLSRGLRRRRVYGARGFEHNEGADRFARDVVGAAHHCGFGHIGVGNQCRLDLHRAHAVATHIDDIIYAPHDGEVARVGVTHRCVARQIAAAQLGRKVAFGIALGIAPNGAEHAGPGPFDDQIATRAIRDFGAQFIHHRRLHTRQRQGARARRERRGTRQRGDDMAAGFGLPKGVDDRAAALADFGVVPHPSLGVDRLADRAQDSQARQIKVPRVRGRILRVGFDQGADRGRRGVEHANAVALNHLPKAPRIGVGRYALKNHLRRAHAQRAIGHIGVAGDPAYVCRAPKHIVRFGDRVQVKSPAHGERRPQQIAARRMHNALGLAGRA